MSANTTLLGLNLPQTGGDSGIWGDDINNGMTELVEVSLAGTNNITTTSDVTLAITNGNNSSTFSSTATNSTVAQYAVINLTGSRSTVQNINVPAYSKTYIVYNNTSGGQAVTVKKTGGTGVSIANGEKAICYYDNVTATDVIKIASSAAGVSLSAANTWTATQTFNGSSSTFATTLLDANETVNVVASAPSATTNFYVQSGGVQYYTSNAANNWTLNIAFSSGTSLNTALSTGQSVTFTLVTTQGSTAYYNNAVTIDGTSVTPKWIGGAPTAGNASGLDVYRYAVVKTASATYTVLASLTQYK